MATVSSRRIPNVILGLSLFWAGVLSAFFWTTGFNFAFLIPWVFALITGAWLAQRDSDAYKKQILGFLKYREKEKLPVDDWMAFASAERGVSSSLGPIPFQYPQLPRLASYSFSDLESHSPPEIKGENALARILGKYLSNEGRSRNAPFVAIFDALVLTYLHPSHLHLPAGIDRHNKRSLLTHHLLVCALMIHRAPDYIYQTGSLTPIDSGYKLEPSDPLIPIIGLSHDIGKIRAYIFDGEGQANALRPCHDSHAARLMAIFSELWDARITPEERRIFLSTLAYQHHGANIPVQKNERARNPMVTSDRLHAILGLLHECDRLASSIEMGASYSFEAEPVVFIAEPVTLEEVAENLFVNFSNYIATIAPINARGTGSKSVAFKFKDEELTYGKEILIFNELEFIASFSEYLKKPELGVREGKSSPLTASILTMLDENGYLFRVKEDVGHRQAINCLFNFEFRDPAITSDDDPTFKWSSCFIVDISTWPRMDRLRALPNCHSKPSIGAARFGAQGIRRRASAAEDAANSALTGAPAKETGMSLEEVIASKKQKIQSNPAKVIQRIGRALASNQFQVTTSDENSFCVIDANDFFKGIGIDLNAADADGVASDLSAFGILKFQRGESSPSQYEIHLAKETYSKFIKIKPTPLEVIDKISIALQSKKIAIAQQYEKTLAIVGFDSFFADLGIKLDAHQPLPPDITACGIVEIKKSKSTPNSHVILLDIDVFSTFAKSAPKPKSITQLIGEAISFKTISIAQESEKAFAIVGFDQFFMQLGINVQEYKDTPPEISSLGITQIKKSKSNPNSHVILLDKALFSRFTEKLTAA